MISGRGSTPRGPGAHMLVLSDGGVADTVGGGSGEAEVIRRGVRAIEEGIPRVVHLEMWADETAEEGMVCGGVMDVWVEPLDPPHDLPWLEPLVRLWEDGKELRLCRKIGAGVGPGSGIVSLESEEGEMVWARGRGAAPRAPTPSGKARLELHGSAKDETRLAVERIVPPDQLIIIGAGHIAVALCRLAAALGFQVTVVDDRPAYASRERFPGATDLHAGDYEEVLGRIPGNERTYCTLVTRGYRADVSSLRALISKKCAYIGMIGSRRRVETVKRILLQEGVSRADLDRIYAPIGLDIRPETPTEIAVSIAAELIQVRRGGQGSGLPLSRR